MKKKILSITLSLFLISNSMGFANVTESKNNSVVAIPVALAAPAVYELMLGVMVAGVSYFAIKIQAPRISGIDFSGIRSSYQSSNQSVTLNSAINKIYESQLLNAYNTIKAEMEFSTNISQNTLVNFMSIFSNYESLGANVTHSNILTKSKTLLDHMLLSANENSDEEVVELEGEELFQGTVYSDYITSSNFDPKCDPNDVVNNFRNLGYQVYRADQKLPGGKGNIAVYDMLNFFLNIATESTFGSELINGSRFGNSSNRVMYLYKGDQRMCKLEIQTLKNGNLAYVIETQIHTMSKELDVMSPEIGQITGKKTNMPQKAVLQMPEYCQHLTSNSTDICQMAIDKYLGI